MPRIEDSNNNYPSGPVCFKKEAGKLEAVLTLRQTAQKQIRKDKITFITFMELDKAFGNVHPKYCLKSYVRQETIIMEKTDLQTV